MPFEVFVIARELNEFFQCRMWDDPEGGIRPGRRGTWEVISGLVFAAIDCVDAEPIGGAFFRLISPIVSIVSSSALDS
jgi:hypothetical protein